MNGTDTLGYFVVLEHSPSQDTLNVTLDNGFAVQWEENNPISGSSDGFSSTFKGLEYLHQGCNTRILQFDIKPQDILLVDNFCPKISGCGLDKLCERKDSIISTISARGTIGYIAPEVFCRSFGGVSHKSDVYSYRMMVLEMVGEKENIHSQTNNPNFPTWIYERLKGADLNLERTTAENEELIRK
ncbi:putative Kinase superfamily protein [Hibiscus syriacus]|uniref:Kinase superfamily protein n=1 Tax=Hibiscus syriacus TaxID=106335 RepID=A0A6A3BCB3_HIBSY|nr:putative Kinase superfamily protein [Hibiscus syriacus]